MFVRRFLMHDAHPSAIVLRLFAYCICSVSLVGTFLVSSLIGDIEVSYCCIVLHRFLPFVSMSCCRSNDEGGFLCVCV